MEAYLSAILGFALLGGVAWGFAALLKRFARFDTASAVLLSLVLVLAVLPAAFYIATCFVANYCGF